MIDLEKLRELAKCQTGKKLCVQAEELASILDRLVALERDAGRMDWIEKNGDVRIQRVRAGFNGPLRWDVEYGPYGDEARSKKDMRTAIDTAMESKHG